jgi:hypothetical protein
MMTKIVGCILLMGFLVICDGTIGDVLSSSVICDGSYWAHSSARDTNESYALSVFTTDKAHIDRGIQTDLGIISSTAVNSSGALGIDEYSNHLRSLEKTEPLVCVFNTTSDNYPKIDEITVSGLLDNAEYNSLRTSENNDQTTAQTLINGSGLILFGKQSSNTTTLINEMSSVHGKMNVLDYTEFGTG